MEIIVHHYEVFLREGCVRIEDIHEFLETTSVAMEDLEIEGVTMNFGITPDKNHILLFDTLLPPEKFGPEQIGELMPYTGAGYYAITYHSVSSSDYLAGEPENAQESEEEDPQKEESEGDSKEGQETSYYNQTFRFFVMKPISLDEVEVRSILTNALKHHLPSFQIHPVDTISSRAYKYDLQSSQIVVKDAYAFLEKVATDAGLSLLLENVTRHSQGAIG